MRVVLGVGGGIAAYKAALLLRLFTEAGHDVTAVPTEAALSFVGKATWEALSGKPVRTDVFEAVETVNHVRLGHEADLVVVAPATADLLARAAGGHADDLLTTTLLMAHCPVLLAPAMHTEMWQHPATRANVALLRERGVNVLEPASGRLTGADSGPGRLPEPEEIFGAALALVGGPSEDDAGRPAGPLAGRRVLVSAGGTREPLDPVRFLGNRSSGKQGAALARAAADAGADVTLVAAHMDVPAPEGARVVSVGSALDLREAMLAEAPGADVVIMAAAVADFRPSEPQASKIKKRDDAADPVITLVRNPDVLVELVQRRNDAEPGQLIVGFAAETGDDASSALDYGRAKLARKGCELLVLNEVGDDATGSERVFGRDSNSVLILARDGEPEHAAGSKDEVAAAVVRRITCELAARTTQ
ncbi:Phosphopantothenoylcysteine decarboxylase/phosphopantothenoylcysteine synthetase [Sinomonas atrocyanea]|uniref:Coenzyme A biosynthesis bifunctional protein CoaBC n=1 Tax=Sinomonas atrocyanea TaxID=37927 RepID=A0A127A113_9MICC|nr:bifunctional phosphopantothenoylcysteine decarboxylase/phosphopantothenate--cysteine ligase CoaBC [Sinomonas atrocyanea]AMM32806.1 Phosphopantothenoylcysteine decarboxylase/phosphopantothenoylcysteine synthetase [Sinomonas atrocyanea]GEB65481.1 phosphopantothenoylcysteine decarboxylase [Sinomonas atrocyanea]GGG74550.1 phosphopantothenoylcysteine decarboxylase [Sinomonas atrocyanea]